MALRPESLIVNIKGQDKFSKVFEKARTSTNNLGSSLGKLKKIALGVGVAVGAMAVGIGVKAVSAASTFEKEMTNVRTLIDESTESFDDMRKGVLDLAKEMPVATSDLTSALYQVISAGIDAAGQFDVLRASAKLATAGLGTTEESVDLVTSAINAFGLDSKNANKWADVFFQSVKAGKTTVAELAQGFGQVAPLANQLGISFEDLMATTSAMTTSGLKASVAYTQIRAAASNLLKPTKEMKEAMDAIGVTSENLNELLEEEGLRGTFMALSDAVDGNRGELAKMFGSVEGLNAVLMLLGETGEASTEIFNNMKSETDALDEAFNKQTETFDAQYKMMQNNLNVAFVTLGTMILPELNKILKENIIPTIQSLTEWFDKNEESIAAVIEGIKEFMGFAGKAAGVATTPLKWISESYIGKSVKNVLGLAEGGVVTRPTMALIGEAGPEAVVPLDKAGSLGNTFNFNFSGAFIGNVGEFKKQLMDSINRDSELKVLGGT